MLVPPASLRLVAMVLPQEIGDAAQDTNRDRVMAWLEGGGSINDVDEDGYTLLNCCACGNRQRCVINDRHVALARHLISLGADVSIATLAGGTSPLLNTVMNAADESSIHMMSLLLGAGANVNTRDCNGDTPLYWAIHPSTLRITIITELLRAGASLDACSGDQTAEDIIQRKESNNSALAGNEHWKEIKAHVHGVRQHGSYKRYARSFHRDVLAVRGLAQRGKLSTSDPVLSFLARRADNGVAWKILEYWRATN